MHEYHLRGVRRAIENGDRNAGVACKWCGRVLPLTEIRATMRFQKLVSFLLAAGCLLLNFTPWTHTLNGDGAVRMDVPFVCVANVSFLYFLMFLVTRLRPFARLTRLLSSDEQG